MNVLPISWASPFFLLLRFLFIDGAMSLSILLKRFPLLLLSLVQYHDLDVKLSFRRIKITLFVIIKFPRYENNKRIM